MAAQRTIRGGEDLGRLSEDHHDIDDDIHEVSSDDDDDDRDGRGDADVAAGDATLRPQ